MNHNTQKPGMFTGLKGENFIFPFILVTTLFALWGFANDITNPMVAAFKNILLISNFESLHLILLGSASQVLNDRIVTA